MMMKKYLLSILCGLFLLPGCNYLDMVPEKDIETIESVFEQRTKVEKQHKLTPWLSKQQQLLS